MKMVSFDFEIQYKSGCKNKVADTSSWNLKFESELQVVSALQVVGLEGVEQEVANDKKL